MVAPGFALLRAADGVIPKGASLVVLTVPPDPTQETWYHRFAVALLPGRKALAAADYGQAAPPETWRGAEYVVVVGARPPAPPGTLLLETGDGSVWKANRP